MGVPDVFMPVDLLMHMREGVKHIYAALDRRQDYRPYFQWLPLAQPPCARHIADDTPHVVGRFLDALARCNAIAYMPDDDHADDALSALIYDSFADDGLPYTSSNAGETPTATMHNCREVLLALLAMHRWKKDSRALSRATEFLRTIEGLTRQTGEFPGQKFDGQKWEPHNDYCVTTGRMIWSLLRYAKISGDQVVLELAHRFGQNMREKCFTPDGSLTENAGHHLHSIEGTMTGLIELGLVSGRRDYIELGKKLYDVGLRPYRMTTGWAQENIPWKPGGRGEANNTTDFVEAAFALAEAGFREYYQDAERMVRNGLLRYQIFDTSWIPQGPEPPDTSIETYQDIASRIRGAFCFASPNGFRSYNADLTGGALQGLCETWHHIITQTGGLTRINMFISRTSPELDLLSHLPREGLLEIAVHRDLKLAVRVPTWTNTVTTQLNRQPVEAAIREHYLEIGNLPAGAQVSVRFDPVGKSELTETVAPGSFTTQWLGDTVVAIDPPGEIMPLYGWAK